MDAEYFAVLASAVLFILAVASAAILINFAIDGQR